MRPQLLSFSYYHESQTSPLRTRHDAPHHLSISVSYRACPHLTHINKSTMHLLRTADSYSMECCALLAASTPKQKLVLSLELENERIRDAELDHKETGKHSGGYERYPELQEARVRVPCCQIPARC
jgi:hypothetical protein